MAFKSKQEKKKNIITFGETYPHQRKKQFSDKDWLNDELDRFHNDKLQSFYIGRNSDKDFQKNVGINKKLDYKFNNKDYSDYER